MNSKCFRRSRCYLDGFRHGQLEIWGIDMFEVTGGRDLMERWMFRVSVFAGYFIETGIIGEFVETASEFIAMLLYL